MSGTRPKAVESSVSLPTPAPSNPVPGCRMDGGVNAVQYRQAGLLNLVLSHLAR